MSATTIASKPRISAAQFEAWRATTREQSRAADAFQNLAANLGWQSANLLEATQYPLTRLSFNYILLQSLYRSHWIVRKIIDAPAEDMTKNWVGLLSDLPPAQLKRFDAAIRLTGTQHQVLTTLKWARLFGGAAAIIVIKGDENRLDEPLNWEDVEPDSYRGLIPLDRWAGISPGAQLCTDIDRPLDFGLPTDYQVTLKTGKTFKIDASRVLRFIGRDVPSWEKEVEMQWGISEIEVIYDELRKRDNTSWNIASLVFRANIIGLRQENLASMLSGLNAGGQVQRNFYATIAAQASLMSNQGLMVLPDKGGLETHTYAFGGVGMMYQQFKEDMAGAAEIPYSRIFGRPPGGLATTNEGDEHVYYERIRAKQERELGPQMQKLFPVVAMSTWGRVPKDFDWAWKPVATLSSTEQANVAVARTGAIVETFNANLISPKTALLELQQMSTETEVWTNITDEDIEAADDRTISPVEGMEMQQAQAEAELSMGQKAQGGGGAAKKLGAKKAAAQDAAAKLTHAEVRYEDPAKGEDKCAGCRHFIPSNACQLVVKPIAATGWCEEFAAKRTEAEDGNWSERSWDSDAVHDILDQYRPKGEKTKGFDEPVPAANVGMVLRELDNLSDSVDDQRRYVGVVVFLVEHGSIVPRMYTRKAEQLAGDLINDAQTWRDPDARVARLKLERTLLAMDAALEARGWDFQGLTIDVENLRGSVRHHAEGTTKMTAPYGYIRNTEGADGDAVDVFVGADLTAPWAYVVHTKDPDTGAYDEDKIVLGVQSAREAKELFEENYDRPGFFGSMDKLRISDLKTKLKTLRGRKLVAS